MSFTSADLDALVAAAPVCAPAEAFRSTGGFRYPEKFQHWDGPTREALLSEREPTAGPVVAVLIGEYNSAVVGPFISPDEAFAWWDEPWNKLRQVLRIVLRQAADPGRAVLDQPAVAYDEEDENAPKAGE